MKNKVDFDIPANYIIVVQGLLRPDWFDRFGSMRITIRSQADEPFTTLQGKVSDQTELAGILNTLYELHMPLISVQLLNKKEKPKPTI